ncbi:DUF6018 family natural product bioysynthesis protein [Terribacillus sp. DMT04]|uniref:DUF6018 family natural product bioysynthesis protein n=1 Tax=Terribacillus sp. DMT04 TaxID=2850441 RepID=UPI001C2BC538|nr:DUF6018 family natural product bioysynthesis protein [Terribacillus sp. DMT04]QXE03552.1 hypothetical protein KS242_17915 [Terribacillus sp. DMT04]
MGSNTAKSSTTIRNNGLARIERVMKTRAQIEYIYKGGQREFYRCKTRNKKEALQEALKFISALEKVHQKKVIWRFKGETEYRIGAAVEKRSIKNTIQKIIEFFFDVD